MCWGRKDFRCPVVGGAKIVCGAIAVCVSKVKLSYTTTWRLTHFDIHICASLISLLPHSDRVLINSTHKTCFYFYQLMICWIKFHHDDANLDKSFTRHVLYSCIYLICLPAYYESLKKTPTSAHLLSPKRWKPLCMCTPFITRVC